MPLSDSQDERPVDADVRRRHFVAVATGSYEDHNYSPLPVAEEVEHLRRWLVNESRLRDRRFKETLPDLAHDPDDATLKASLVEASRRWTERDAVVVFVTGHGQEADNTHWLVLKESESDWLPATAFRTADLISWLRRRNGVKHLLLIIDACFAGAIVKDTIRLDDSLPKTWLVLPSATKNSEATALALTTAIGKTVENLRGGEGERFGINRRYFRVSDFIDTLRRYLEEEAPGQELDPIYRGDMNAEHVCLPNPHYREDDTVVTGLARHELALPKQDLERHWAPRALGSGDTKTGAPRRWLFTGRAELMSELIATARGDHDDDSRVTLITGGAGSGKSAVLARLVTLSDPDFIAAYSREVAEIPDDLRPDPAQGIDVAVVATGKYPHEIIGQVGDALGAVRPNTSHGDVALQRRIDAVITALNDRPVEATVVVDALDEAIDPLGITRALSLVTAATQTRLLVGVRSPSGPQDRPGPMGSHGPLADQVEKLLGARRLPVDEEPWWNQDDVRGYAESILLHTPGSPYADHLKQGRAAALASVIARRVGRTFLVARLAATALTERSDLVKPDDAAWLATLDEGVVGVFRADLQRVYPDPDARLRAVELLRAVAFAYGRGLPWGEIWPTVANAVADRHGRFGDRDIAELLASPMSAYLVTDVEDDVTVYRLFHDALRGTLRARWRELVESDDD